MENKIKNPVSKKNIFFFNIFDRLINSIEKYVYKTEQDTFAENFDIVNGDSTISIMPKGSTVEKLSLGNKYSSLTAGDESFDAYVHVTNDDRFVEIGAINKDDTKNVDVTINEESISHGIGKSGIDAYRTNILFDKNGISVNLNNTTYDIHEPQLSTIVNACEYSYDKDNTTHKLKMLPKVNNLNLANTPLEINFGKNDYGNLMMRFDDQGINLMGNNIDGGSTTLFVNNEIHMDVTKQYNNKLKQASITMRTDMNEPDIVIEHINSSGETNANKVLSFIDNTNNLNVTFTVAELIALKALLPTT